MGKPVMQWITMPARQLLAVDAARRSREGNVARLIPAGVAVLNLFVGAAFEETLRWDRTGHGHASFFLVECVVYALLNISFFAARTSNVLARTRIFPLRPLDRYASTLVADLRRREVLALALSGSGCLGVIHAHAPGTALAAILLYLEMLVATGLVISTINVLVFRSPAPAATALALGGIVSVAVMVALLAFGMEDLLLPPARWAAAGVMASARGDAVEAFVNAAFIAAVGAAAALLGTRKA